MRNHSFLWGILLLMDGLFVALTDVTEVKPVLVMKGDSVTLNTGVTDIQRDKEIQWMFGQSIVGRIKDGIITTSVDDEQFRDRLKLDKQTGSLTITNIRTEHDGLYELFFIGSTETSKKFHVTVYGMFEADGTKPISVMQGDPVTLQTRITDIPRDDVIEWTFGPQKTFIVKTDREKGMLLYNEDDIRFTNRLHLNIQTGDLKISNTDPKVSGLYQLKIIKSTYTLEKSFSVTVTGSDRSGAVSGISGASVGLMLWAVAVFLLKEV
ncbi:uncharacterized protein [Pseudorasbora parva]|uniref:uncharacterized protein isoform X1 n=1 Tax=Pseudorasbora parva TaxID=51549 RepID=UPI00351E7FC6